MTTTRDLREIERLLTGMEWVPTRDEFKLGCDFIDAEYDAVTVAAARGYPRGRGRWEVTTLEYLTVVSLVVERVERELLPAARARFPGGSPMVDLVELMLAAAVPVLPYARQLQEAWAAGGPEARRGETADYRDTQPWEDALLGDGQEVVSLYARTVSVIRSVLVAVVTGDITH
ncbi:hypothetical protein [Streptomyces laurentii]|uniref:hypothetical protein n=1 Tax=Streptomyces laurentii TaxID=39478 RepID=UPI0033FE9A47